MSARPSNLTRSFAAAAVFFFALVTDVSSESLVQWSDEQKIKIHERCLIIYHGRSAERVVRNFCDCLVTGLSAQIPFDDLWDSYMEQKDPDDMRTAEKANEISEMCVQRAKSGPDLIDA